MTEAIISWAMFCIAFGLMLLLTFIMSLQSLHFYTKDVVEKKFSIMDLEIPATSTELVNLIKGLYKLPEQKSRKAISALKGQLYIDFLFMPCAYGAIFLLCMMVSAKMKMPFGVNIYMILAWLQLVPLLCDIIENFYLLYKIKPKPVLSSPPVHKAYLLMQVFKWGIALTATICAIAAICYFWLAGHYTLHALNYLLIIGGEIILFLIFGKIFLKNKKNEIN